MLSKALYSITCLIPLYNPQEVSFVMPAVWQPRENLTSRTTFVKVHMVRKEMMIINMTCILRADHKENQIVVSLLHMSR